MMDGLGKIELLTVFYFITQYTNRDPWEMSKKWKERKKERKKRKKKERKKERSPLIYEKDMTR